MTNYKYIFDLDGTLYRFDKESGSNFMASQFYLDIKENCYRFLSQELVQNRSQAIQTYDGIFTKFKGEVSLGVEKTFGINRYKYFTATWDLEPQKYLNPNKELDQIIKQVSGKSAILTSAPLVWAKKVLIFLKIDKYFENSLFTGENTIRKPNPEAFNQVLKFLDWSANQVISIGDQEQTDILPAKKLGMKTILVGSESCFADYSIETINDFPKLLTKIEKGEN